MEEDSWRLAPLTNGFFKQVQNQGGKPAFDTDIRILYNKEYLYFGFFCYDSLGKKGLRVPYLHRDFDWGNNDIVGVILTLSMIKGQQ